MADPPPRPDFSSDAEPTTGPPRWAKVFGIVALVVVVLFVVLLLAGGPGEHGPGRHRGGGGGNTPSSSIGHVPPAGGHAPS